MKIRIYKLIYASIACVVLTNFLLLNNINFIYSTSLIAFFTFLVLPGLISGIIFRFNRISHWEYFSIAVGISIIYLEFGGLLANQLLPRFGNMQPLALRPLLVVFDVGFLLLLAYVRIKRKEIILEIPSIRISWQKILLFGVPATLPIFAAVGAISINNGGTNLITLLLLGLIGAYSLGIVFLHKKIPTSLYPHTIFFTSLALLLTTSLRGWYIAGHDIQREYYVFMLTYSHSLWNMSLYRDAYNACLSITILPTVLTHLLSIQDIYVYKLIYQILFATCPVIIFFLLKKYTTKIYSFISVLYFLSFPTFFNDMPFLTRQEIGFIFFGILLYVTLLPHFSIKIRKIIFILAGFGIIISHYSTNYVVIVLLTSLLISTYLLKKQLIHHIIFFAANKLRISTLNSFHNEPFINWKMLMILLCLTFFWNTQFTKTSNNLKDVSHKILQSIFIKSSHETKSVDVSYSLFFSHKSTPTEQLDQYIQQNIIQAKKRNEGPFYDKSLTDQYPVKIIPSSSLPYNRLGKLLVSLHLPVSTFLAGIRQLSASFLQIFIFTGMLVMLLNKKRYRLDLQYILLSTSGIVLLLLMIVIPEISVEYGLLRLFQQLLFLLSLQVVLATDFVFHFFVKTRKIYLVGCTAVIFFLNLTGFISHITGGYSPQFTLENSGLYYDAFYVRQTDVSSVEWLKKNKKQISAPVQTDNSGISKLLLYGEIQGLREIFPEIIRQNSYVYLTDASIKNAIVSFEANTLIFTSPINFLSKNKDLIYNNGSTRIYK